MLEKEDLHSWVITETMVSGNNVIIPLLKGVIKDFTKIVLFEKEFEKGVLLLWSKLLRTSLHVYILRPHVTWENVQTRLNPSKQI